MVKSKLGKRWRHQNNTIYICTFTLIDRNDHTTVTAPLPVCSAKLSTVGPDDVDNLKTISLTEGDGCWKIGSSNL
eukprot:scaffold616_cov146-Skeletonema_menzelii.AAC.18